MAINNALETLSRSVTSSEAAKSFAEIQQQLSEALSRANASGIGEMITSFLATITDAEIMMGVGAFVATAVPARVWTKEALANDGKVSMNEKLGIGARATMMAAGTYMFEGAMVHDPASALAAAALLGVELKLGYDVFETLKSGELNPIKNRNLGKKDYWVKVLKTAGKALGALVVIPKLNLVLFAANPMDTVAGEVGAGLVMAANYDQVAKLLKK